MIIHVVSSGETLWSISNRYRVTVQQIIEINGLQNIPYLIIGQALIIPVKEITYVVQPGDSLWAISQRFNASMASIISLNNITNPNLIYPGMRLRIPLDSSTVPKSSIEVMGYIVPSNPTQNVTTINQLGRYLTYATISSYTLNKDGTLNPVPDEAIIQEASSQQVGALLSISNLGGGNFDPDLGRIILSSESIQQTLFDNILSVLNNKGYRGVHINFERLYPEDRQLYNQFMERAVEFFHRHNYPVSTAMVAKTYDQTTGEWWGAHDYKTLGSLVDYVLLMTYDFGCAFCEPGAIAPINEVRKVLDYAVSVIPSQKILMGINLYGYNWRLPHVSVQKASTVHYTSALQLAAQHGAQIQYDSQAQAPYFNYTDANGTQRVVWFEDARSLRAKYNLVKQYNLRGVGYWQVSFPAPQNWPILTNIFNVLNTL